MCLGKNIASTGSRFVKDHVETDITGHFPPQGGCAHPVVFQHHTSHLTSTNNPTTMTSMSSPPTVPALSTTLTARIRALDLTKLPYCTSDKYLTTTALKQAFKSFLPPSSSFLPPLTRPSDFINNLALLELACDHGEKMISLVLNSTFHHLVDTVRSPCLVHLPMLTTYTV